MRAWWAVVVALLSPSAHADTRSLTDLPAELVTLPNGLRVVLAPDPQARLVSVDVQYGGGSADDPNGLRGLAHLTEHLSFVRTAHATGLLGKLVASGACHVNGTTSEDSTRYFETVPPERLDVALWIESERMGYVVDAVDEDAVAQERTVVTNELRERHSNNRAARAITTSLFPPWHPYAAESDTDEDLDRIHAVDIQAFLRTWYVPSNATLVLAGRFDRDAALASVTRYFGSIPAAQPPVRPPLPAWTSEPATILVSTYATSSSAMLVWRTPGLGTPDDRALDLVAAMLAGPGNDLLGPALVESHATTALGAHELSQRDASTFVVFASVAPSSNPQQVISTIASATARLATKVSPAEAAQARATLRAETRGELATTWGRAERLQALVHEGVVPGPGFDWGLRAYDAIDETALSQAARRWLGPEHRVTEAVFVEPGAWRTTVKVNGVQQNQE